MLRKLHAFLALGMSFATAPVAAQDFGDEPVGEDATEPSDSEPSDVAGDSSEAGDAEPAEAPAEDAPSAEASAEAKVDLAGAAADMSATAPPTKEEASEPSAWDVSVTGYFRAPMAIGIAPRQGPDQRNGGPANLQLSYGPNRTVDSSYYSFAYTRLQEQDWAEFFVEARREHVTAAVGTMGYWFQGAGFRNNDAAWSPGLAYLTLDTDVDLGGIKPNVALTGGAWWPKFGAFDKYDTYTLGRFRHVGEQLAINVPVTPEVTISLTQGFGSARDGSSNILAPPPYQAKVGLILLHYEHLSVSYKDLVSVGVHYNHQWTRDPNLFQTTVAGKAFNDARQAFVSTIGGEVTVKAPYVGTLWVSPSMIEVSNGWALAQGGIEVMHSLSGDGLATNYLGWSGSLPDSSGSGTLRNVGFAYQNKLSNLTGDPEGTVPEVTFNAFGLFADITLDLPPSSVISQDRMGQFKYGADVEVHPFKWLGVMVRWDEVNYNLGHPGYVFSAISPRVTFSSHFLSGESIYIQYSRYRYGDHMQLSGRWPWGTPLVAGTDIVQGGAYAQEKPDMDVVRLQASVSF